MLYRLEIENFYSVRDRQVLDLRLPRNVPDYPERFAPIFAGAEERAPKVVMLFGPNGSGKSTVLKALAVVAWFLGKSFQHKGPLPFGRFNDEQSATRPICLAVELGDQLNFGSGDETKAENHGTYRYELELMVEDGGVGRVTKEALRQRKQGRGKWVRLFERDGTGRIEGSKTFPLSGLGRILEKVPPHASVVATMALFEHEASHRLVHAASKVFSNILTDRVDPADLDVVDYLAQDPSAVDALNCELQRIDVGIEEMQIVQTATGPAPLFKHAGLKLGMPWVLESHGTRAFIRAFPLLFWALRDHGIAVVDELDRDIHPLLLPEIVRWFHDPDRNPGAAQLWASCHSVSLLDELTKEEVVLCEKDRMGRSSFYRLSDVQAVRRSDDFYKKYLGGAYGAVPQIG